jgi:hypothetical protein
MTTEFEARFRIPAAGFRPSLASVTPENQRAQAMPGALRTRSFVRNKKALAEDGVPHGTSAPAGGMTQDDVTRMKS